MLKWIVGFAAVLAAAFLGARLALRPQADGPSQAGARRTNRLVRCGMIAAVYVVLWLALQPFSYGAVQVRLAEALCLLPVFGPEYIAGVTLGCLLANALGSTVIDVVFGTLATLLACLVTYRLRGLRPGGLGLPAARPPVPWTAVKKLAIPNTTPSPAPAAGPHSMAPMASGTVIRLMVSRPTRI